MAFASPVLTAGVRTDLQQRPSISKATEPGSPVWPSRRVLRSRTRSSSATVSWPLRRLLRRHGYVQPSSRKANPAFQIFVMRLNLSPLKYIT